MATRVICGVGPEPAVELNSNGRVGVKVCAPSVLKYIFLYVSYGKLYYNNYFYNNMSCVIMNISWLPLGHNIKFKSNLNLSSPSDSW